MCACPSMSLTYRFTFGVRACEWLKTLTKDFDYRQVVDGRRTCGNELALWIDDEKSRDLSAEPQNRHGPRTAPVRPPITRIAACRVCLVSGSDPASGVGKRLDQAPPK